MISCEICGRPIKGIAYKIIVDGTEMIVCSDCAKKYGKKVEAIPVNKLYKSRKKKFSRRKMKRNIAEWEVIEDFAERIKIARDNMGLSRDVLAQMIREKESTLRRIESGTLEPTIELAKKLERVLRIKLLEPASGEMEEELFDYEDTNLTLGDIVRFKSKKKGG